MASFIGERILIKVSWGDGRKVEAFTLDRKPIGILRAKGMWGRYRHTIWFRQLYFKLSKEAEFIFKSNPVHAVAAHLEKKSRTSKKYLNMLVAMVLDVSATVNSVIPDAEEEYTPQFTDNDAEELPLNKPYIH